MGSFASAAAIRRDVAELIRPPRRVRASVAAADVMRVVMGDGTVREWDPTLTPYMVEPLDCMASRRYDSVIFAGPARTGKTLALIAGYVAYKIECDPGDGLIVQISEEKAREFSKKTIDRMLTYSPRLRDRLSSRGHDNNVHDRTFRAGNYLGIKWPSKNVLASSDYQFVLLTDFDRLAADIDGEGDPFTLAGKRTQTFGSTGMTMAESSPGREVLDPDWRRPEEEPHMAPPTTGILSLFNHGDRRRWYWQCPHCSEWFQPVMEHFDRTAARAFCPHCGTQLDPAAKRALNAGGRWLPEGCKLTPEGEVIGTARPGRVASFWMEGPAAAYQSWQSLAEKLQRAEAEFETLGSQESLRSVINTDWGRPYASRVAAKTRSSMRLMDRAEQIGGDRVFRRRQEGRRIRKRLALHDAGIVDDDIDAGMRGGRLCGKGLDVVGVHHVDGERRHAGIGRCHLVECLLPAAGDDHLVAELVESFRQRPADAGIAAGDENGVACHLHASDPLAACLERRYGACLPFERRHLRVPYVPEGECL